MFVYNILVSMSDPKLSISDSKIIILLKKAIQEVNSSKNSRIKGRFFELGEIADEKHINIILKSNTEVVPTKAMSSISRAILSIDTEKIITTYRGCVFYSEQIPNPISKSTSLTDVELLQELTALIFGQHKLDAHKDKNLAREYTEKIRSLVLDFIQKKSI